MTLAELRAKRASLQDQIDAILAKDELTDEDRENHDELEKQFLEASEQITLKEDAAMEDEKRRLRSEERRKAMGTSQRKAVTTAIGNPRHAWEDDPKGGFKDHREFFGSILSSAKAGRITDERLKARSAAEKFAAAGSDEQSSISDPHGGYLVPSGLLPGVLMTDVERDPIGPLTTKIPMENPVVNINARTDKDHTSSVSGGLTVYRRSETQAVSSSRMVFEQVELRAHSLMGLAYATEEILARSPMSFVALIDAGFRDEFNNKLIDERLNGDGNGKFEGIINAAATITQTAETGQTATTIVYENLIKMRSRCWGYGNAVWLANHDTLPQLMLMNQSLGTGGAIVWQPSGREDHPDTLLGRPIYFTEYTQTLGTAGDIVLGNWSQYLEGTLTAPQSAESMHVRFENHERTFKFWLENDGKLWWRSALTPKNSSNTLSPFVVLATRS